MILKYLLERRKLKLKRKLKKLEFERESYFESVRLLKKSYVNDLRKEISALELVLKIMASNV